LFVYFFVCAHPDTIRGRLLQDNAPDFSTLMWEQIRSGTWLTPARLRDYPLILLLISIVAAVIWIALADGLIDRQGKPIGTDFSNVWAAGRLVLDGEPAAPYDPVRQHAAEQQAFAPSPVPFFGWHYPPFFLIVAAGLAWLPYAWSLLTWMTLTLPAYLAVIRSIVPRAETTLLALAFPAVYVNLGHGQNGFLTAALLGGSLVLLDKWPTAAGVLIGLLAYKPQFGLLIPLALVAAGHWRAVAAASLTVLLTCAVTLILFGPEVWQAFFSSTGFTRSIVLEAGGTGWEKIQSLFSAIRLWGGSIEAAYAGQAALALALGASLAWLWHGAADGDLKSAALPCACLLATPYVLDYDFVVLAVAMAFFARFALVNGFRDYEISALALVWIMPLLARSCADTLRVPLGLICVALLYGLILRRAFAERQADAQKSNALVRA
jgi:Glycosyltransferase family 87